jgi:hypothetical protein
LSENGVLEGYQAEDEGVSSSEDTRALLDCLIVRRIGGIPRMFLKKGPGETYGGWTQWWKPHGLRFTFGVKNAPDSKRYMGLIVAEVESNGKGGFFYSELSLRRCELAEPFRDVVGERYVYKAGSVCVCVSGVYLCFSLSTICACVCVCVGMA